MSMLRSEPGTYQHEWSLFMNTLIKDRSEHNFEIRGCGGVFVFLVGLLGWSFFTPNPDDEKI